MLSEGKDVQGLDRKNWFCFQGFELTDCFCIWCESWRGRQDENTADNGLGSGEEAEPGIGGGASSEEDKPQVPRHLHDGGLKGVGSEPLRGLVGMYLPEVSPFHSLLTC